MKSHIIQIPTAGISYEQWLRNRKNGIGASDVSTVMGMNRYKSPIELWYERISPAIDNSPTNAYRFMGHFHEEGIAKLWEYWAGSPESMMKNYAEGNIVRRCRKINATISNPNFPWLFASLDRIINKGDRGEEGALELKTIGGYEAKKWQDGIPRPYVIQLNTQMLVAEFSYGELATMQDGVHMNVWQFNMNQNIAREIVEATFLFWESIKTARVLMTRKYEALMSYNMRLANECQAQIELLEPELVGTEAEDKFLTEHFKNKKNHIGLKIGSEQELEVAFKLKAIKAQIKFLESDAQLQENTLKRAIGEMTTLDFGSDGKVTWDKKTFRLSLKK